MREWVTGSAARLAEFWLQTDAGQLYLARELGSGPVSDVLRGARLEYALQEEIAAAIEDRINEIDQKSRARASIRQAQDERKVKA